MKTGSIYELEGSVPLKQAIPLGIQHVLAMFLGNVSPLIIVCGLLDIPLETKSMLIQNSMFVAGIATLIQLYPFFRVGSGLPVVMGTSSGFIGTQNAIGATYGYSAIMGASLVGAVLEMVLGFFIKPLRKLFPPIVTSLVVISIRLSLLPVGIKYFAGGAGSADFGSPKHLIVGTVVILVIIVLQNFTKGFIKTSAILIGIIVGYILSIVMGMVDFTAVKEASWISLPKPFAMGFEFRLDAIISMAIMYIATTVETIGDISAIAVGGLDREATDKELSGGVVADGVSSFIAAIFGVAPNTSFSQNVGLIAMTKVVNRFAIATGAAIMILAGIFPIFGALLATLPDAVLGGCTIMMFGTIVVSGLQMIGKCGYTQRNITIAALSLSVGIGFTQVPELFAIFPEMVQNVFGQNCVAVVFLVSIILNLVLPQNMEATIQEKA